MAEIAKLKPFETREGSFRIASYLLEYILYDALLN